MKSDRLADIRILAPVTIVIPTYKEVENIPHILARLAKLKDDYQLEGLEVLFMDDQSRDGSAEAVADAGHDWARLIERQGPRGLSPAVIDGFRQGKNPVVICMDCDLSHPPEKIPDLVLALQSGQEFVIGSRYVPGGSTDDDWGLFRWLNSKVATLLARPLTDAKDPMSGFFAMRRSDFDKAKHLNPVGYKVGLELIVKCGLENVGEVPIHFTDRVHGESKLSFKEQLLYLKHLRRLYMHRFGTAMDVAQFAMVGASGVLVNLAILTLVSSLGAADNSAIAAGVGVSVVSNFVLNRRFTFSHARGGNPWKQFVGFALASAVGMVINYVVAVNARVHLLDEVSYGLQLSAVLGIAAGMSFNFIGNRYVVFRKKRLRTLEQAAS